MGRLGQNPSSRGYATPTYATTPLTARETFGGNSKAGLGRHIGMGPFTYGAIVNGSGGHQASFLAGNSFPAAFRAGQLLDMKYPISNTNQLARIGTGTTGGMTRTPADGVNLKQREEMQTRVDKWNKVWPAMPQRDTPNGCCKSIPHLNQDDDHTNLTANETLYGNNGGLTSNNSDFIIDLTNLWIIWFDENSLANGLYFSVTQKVYWRTNGDRAVPTYDYVFGNDYSTENQNNIIFTTTDNTKYTFTLTIDDKNNITSITKLMTTTEYSTQNLYDVEAVQVRPPVYIIGQVNGKDGANLAGKVYDTYDKAKNTITNSDINYITQTTQYGTSFDDIETHMCNINVWIYPNEADPTHYYIIEARGSTSIFLGGTDKNGDIIVPSADPCNNGGGGNEDVGGGALPDLTKLFIQYNNGYLYFFDDFNKIYWGTSSNDITNDEKALGMDYNIDEETNTISATSSNGNIIEFIFYTRQDDNSIISITEKITIDNESNSNTYNIGSSSYDTPAYTIIAFNGANDANLAYSTYESYQAAQDAILEIMGDNFESNQTNVGIASLYICGQQIWNSNTTNNIYTIIYALNAIDLIIAGTDSEGILLQPSVNPCP